MKKKQEIGWKVTRTPLWKRIKYSPIFFYLQYKHCRKDGCNVWEAFYIAYWFTYFMLV